MLLVDYYIKFFNENMMKEIKGVTENVKNAFLNYNWPGNVRELRNMIESGFNLCESEYIDLKDIDSDYLLRHNDSNDLQIDREEAHSLKEKLQRYERYIIKEAVNQCGSQVKAANRLGISRQTLNNKIKALHITDMDIKE